MRNLFIFSFLVFNILMFNQAYAQPGDPGGDLDPFCPVAIFNVSGGGSICAGSSGATITLSNAENGVTYSLYLDGTLLNFTSQGGTPGNSINWVNRTAAGIYTVKATHNATNCTQMMNSSATIAVNPLPTSHTVSGGGTICVGASGKTVNLSDSEVGVDYQLRINGSNSGSTVPGTGSALSWLDQTTSGAYTVVATSATTGCTQTMPGAATITIAPLPVQYDVSGGGSICLGSSATITLNNSENGVTYTLYFNGSLVNYSSQGGTPGNSINWGYRTASGVYTVMATHNATNCTQMMNGSASITDNPLPTQYTIGGATSYCEGGPGVTITLSSSQTEVNYQLRLNDTDIGTVVAGNGSSLMWTDQTSTGTYTIIGIDAASGCSRPMFGSRIVTSKSLPSLFSMSEGDLCAASGSGATISLDGSQIGIDYYLKRNGDFTSASVPGTGSPISWTNQTTAGTYQIEAFHSNGCSILMTGSAVVNALPSVQTVGGGGTFCGNTTASYSVYCLSQTGINYQLKLNGTDIYEAKAGTGGTLFWSNPPSGNYTVVATNPTTGCTRTMNGSPVVTLNPAPTVYLVGGGGSMCSGSSGLAITLSGSETGINYQLQLNGGNSGSPLAGTGGALSWSGKTSAGTYTVVATNPTTTCTQNMEGSPTITVGPSPNLHSVSGGGTFCGNASSGPVRLVGSQIGVNYQLKVDGTDTGTPKAGTGSSLYWQNPSPGSYTVVATNATTGCTRTMNGITTVTINPLPAQYTVGGGGNFCSGSSGLAITLSNSETGINYQLQLNGGNSGSAFAGTGGELSWPGKTSAGTYTVVATNPTTTCTQGMTGSVTITVSQLPAAQTVGGGGTFCGNTASYSVYCLSQAGINYQLKLNGTDIYEVKAGTGGTLFWSNPPAGNYTVVATNPTTGCSRTMNGNPVVTLNPLPTQFAVGGGGNWCSGTSGVSVTLSGSQAGINYQLKFGSSNMGSPLSGTGSSLTWPDQISTGTYTILATDPTTGCSQSMEGWAVVTSSLSPASYSIQGDGTSCPGVSGVTIYLSGSQSGVNYQLKVNGSPVGPPIAGNSNFVSLLTWLNQDKEGLYTIVATNTTTGCTQNMSGSATVTSDPTCAKVDKYAFRYKYDARNRMIGKKVPGADWVYMVYDERDRLVMSQDGEQYKANKWSYTKYDALNRPIITGIYTHSAPLNQAAMSALISTTNFFETYNGDVATHGYTNNLFSSENFALENFEVLSVNYYDDYDFTSLINNTEFEYKTGQVSEQYEFDPSGTQKNYPYVRGQITGTKTKVFDQSLFLWSVNYFDDKYRLVQTTSNNHIGGIDRTTNKYDFVGKVREAKTVQTKSSGNFSVKRKFDYDHAGRLTKTWHSVNGQPLVLLSQNEYNELGQLVTKKLHSSDNGSAFKQHVDYRYNIRGWLTRMNNSNLAPENVNDPGDLFGMNLLYEEHETALGNQSAFNGNISAMKWSTNLGLGVNDAELEIFEATERAYTFGYDAMNRLKSASHLTHKDEWNPDASFHENNLQYDLNGNIQTLNRTGKAGSLMDELGYTYSGNQLLKVDDADDKTIGFIDGSNTDNDYTYDANGNMIQDKNKSIDEIAYNLLNLPEKVTKSTGDYIRYTYDATGRKLSQSVYDASDVLQKKTDYAAEFFYENDVLKFINNEEGRVVMGGEAPEYQYNLKDHLGNVRATFTTKEEVDEFTATLEDAQASDERGDFPNYDDVTISGASAYNHTIAPGATKSVVLNGAPDLQVGLAKSFRVVPGDVIDIEVYAKYFEQGTTGGIGNAIASTVTGAFGLSSGSIGPELSAFQSLSEMFSVGWIMSDEKVEDINAPKGYLNYILFDEDFIPYDFGFDQISDAANATASHDFLTLQATARKPGYVYIYFSNEETSEVIEMYFDDFYIRHTHSSVVQADDYYPFGLTYNSYSRENTVLNIWKFQGQEHVDDLGLNWDSFKWRNHQPDIGRFFNIDPLSEKYLYNSPYAFSENKVVAHRELEGLESHPVNPVPMALDVASETRVHRAGSTIKVSSWTGSGNVTNSTTINIPSSANQSQISDHTAKTVGGVLMQTNEPDGVITSVQRDAEAQARAMFNNAEKPDVGKAGLYADYGAGGERVADTYGRGKAMQAIAQNFGGTVTGTQIKGMMENTINDVGIRSVTPHAADPNVLQVVDIAPSSIENDNQFMNNIDNSTGKGRPFSKRIFPGPGRSEKAYHVEIPQPQSQNR